MLTELTADTRTRSWTGAYFIGYMSPTLGEPITGVWFRAFDNGITFGFSAEHWATVGTLFSRAWERPDIRLAWDAMMRDYGEL